MKNLLKQIVSIFNRKSLPTELDKTIDDAEKMVKETFKAVDAVKLLKDVKTRAYKETETYIPERIKAMNDEIKKYAFHGYTFMKFRPDLGFAFFGGVFTSVRQYIFDQIRKDFESRGFLIEVSPLNNKNNTPLIHWASKEPEERVVEILR